MKARILVLLVAIALTNAANVGFFSGWAGVPTLTIGKKHRVESRSSATTTHTIVSPKPARISEKRVATR